MTLPVIVTIDATGITAVPFSEVLAYFQSQFRTIYGADIVIDADTQDGQLLGVYSQALDDTNNAAVTAFNSFRPGFAVGAGLSSIVKINGISRKIATNSLVTVTLGGTVGTVIQNAYVRDNMNLNTEWFIPGPVEIPPAGVINAQAVCTSQGAIRAGAGTINQIVTPIPGWQTVTNINEATIGNPIENDAQLRRRQTQSTSIPAESVLSSIQGNLLAVPSVSRGRVYENDTFATDANGIPPHSIAAVVEGTDPVAIATSIRLTKPPGVPTYGNIHQTIIDARGVPGTINYWQLIDIEIYALVNMRAVAGYSDAIGAYVQAAIAQFINNMQIGDTIHLGDVYSPANLDGDAAMEATLLPQSALDPLGATYSVTAPYGLALARPEMTAAGGPYTTGNAINVVNSALYYVGESVWITMDPLSYFFTQITAIVGSVLYFADPIPSGFSVDPGAVVYAVGDVFIDFWGAATMTNVNQVILQVT